MNVLAIGNSFSQDAFGHLHNIAAAEGDDIRTVNLYIGGCSLERHYNNMVNDICDYDYEENDCKIRKSTLKAALEEGNWDVISLQQVSGYSGINETYHPYLEELYAYVHKMCPGAKIVFHETWAYECDSTHGDFPKYDCDQEKMMRAIKACYEKESAAFATEYIPVGEVIQAMRKRPLFDRQNGGKPLTRDGFHLSLGCGRYAAGMTWYACLTGKMPKGLYRGKDNALLGDDELLTLLDVLRERFPNL